jgi:ElaB/YqjD/DUF883 family membrane-anchored ribosome-binding protein
MNKKEEELKQLFDSLRKVLFYVGHGKYNDYMSTEEVQEIKAKLEKILDIEKKYQEATTDEEKDFIYEKVEKFKTYSVKDFIDYEIEKEENLF